MDKEQLTRKSWDEFRNTKLLWWINRSLHLFGWAIAVELDQDGKIKDVYPARTKFRGFNEDSESDGFAGLTDYLKNNIEELHKETKN